MIVFAGIRQFVEHSLGGGGAIPIAFLVGAVSFFSPCVLPLVPGYLSYMSGVNGQQLESGSQKGRVLIASFLFVFGLSLVFSLLGFGIGVLGSLLDTQASTLNAIAGSVVIFMGLIFLMTLAVKPLVRGCESSNPVVRRASKAGLAVARVLGTERGVHARVDTGLAGAPFLGAAFAVSWTPCVGPGLSVILGIAAPEGSPAKGVALLFAFSLGFGMWFVLAALAFRRATRAFGFIKRHLRVMVAFGGALMVSIGILMVTNQWNNVLAPLRRLINRWTPPI